MRKLLLSTFLLPVFLIPSLVKAQIGVNYEDVGVIMNINDSTSMKIAYYFAAARNIPASHIIPVSTSTNEEINDSLFADYVLQIRTYFYGHHLADSLNYIVTTKGCPLKVLRDNMDCNASVESELMLMTAGYDTYIGDCVSFDDIAHNRFFTNPYFQETHNFSQSEYSIYLVTRLDAYTYENVIDLIDRSGPNIYVNKDSVLFVLDQSPNWTNQPLNAAMGAVATTLTNRGWQVNFNTDSIYVTAQQNVIGYTSWGSNDGYSDHYTEHARPNNSWWKGSIAETGVSTSGRSFQPNTVYGQSLIADLLAEGATGAKGYVYEPFTTAIATSNILFDRYTDALPDGTPKYNLAESYFAASRMIGWMDVVIGDPKTSITTNPNLSVGIRETQNVAVQVFPNPAANTIYIRAERPLSAILLTDITGRQVLSLIPTNAKLDVDVNSLPSGLYNLCLQMDDKVVNRKISIAR